MTTIETREQASASEPIGPWVSLGTAAALIDVSKDTILRRGVPWQLERVPNRIRFKLLKLDPGTRQERRYLAPDLEALLCGCETEPEVAKEVFVVPQTRRQDARPLALDFAETVEPRVQAEGEAPCLPNESSPVQQPSTEPRFKHMETGIYQHRRSRTYFERPHIDGKRTWRSLRTKNLKFAREELHRRRAAALSGNSSYGRTNGHPDTQVSTVGEVIRRYEHDNYPDRHLNSRPEATRADEERHCDTLLGFWNAITVNSVTVAVCDRYREWRLERIKQGVGLRAIDRELNTLNNAFRYATRRELVGKNPLVDRPRYQPSKLVAHCRQFMPGNADELHEIARQLYRFRSSEVLGFQLLFTAFTGQRTCEILKMKVGAGPEEPGHVTEDGKCLRVWRAKGQDIVNPFCAVHEGLDGLLRAHKQWLERRYPSSLWFFPGRGGDAPVQKAALAHALKRMRAKGALERKIIPHGARAYFVTVRRSQGASDNQIALEIGHTSGGSTLSAVYGGVPPDWLKGHGPKMSWLPSGKPAWTSLETE